MNALQVFQDFGTTRVSYHCPRTSVLFLALLAHKIDLDIKLNLSIRKPVLTVVGTSELRRLPFVIPGFLSKRMNRVTA